MTEPTVAVLVTCMECGEAHLLIVNEARYFRWKAGEGLIQNMLPELTLDQRELLISGVCGTCFYELFKEESDD